MFDDKPGFPPTFEIGELKPQYKEEFPLAFATGMLQVDAYTSGFHNFAIQAGKDSKNQITSVPTGSAMKFGSTGKAIKIPVEIDLTKRKSQPATSDPKKALFNREANKRVWIITDPKEAGCCATCFCRMRRRGRQDTNRISRSRPNRSRPSSRGSRPGQASGRTNWGRSRNPELRRPAPFSSNARLAIPPPISRAHGRRSGASGRRIGPPGPGRRRLLDPLPSS